MSFSVSIRSLTKADEPFIRDLFFKDVYLWTKWVKPIFLHGILGLLSTLICLSIVFICIIGCYHLRLALILALLLTSFILVASAVKLFFFLTYFWRIPEFLDGNLTEVYCQNGFAFFVAEVAGRIIGCVGVQKIHGKVRFAQIKNMHRAR